MNHGDRYGLKGGAKDARLSRTQILLFQMYYNTRRCCWNFSTPRECIRFSRILLDCPYTYMLPLIASIQSILTLILCHILANKLSHLPYKGIFIPFIHFLTIYYPERSIFVFGYLIGWLLFVSSIPMLYHLLYYHLPQPLEVWVPKDIESLYNNDLGEIKEYQGDLETLDDYQDNLEDNLSVNDPFIANDYIYNQIEQVNEYNLTNGKNTIVAKQGVLHRTIATIMLKTAFICLTISVLFAFLSIFFPFGLNFKRLFASKSTKYTMKFIIEYIDTIFFVSPSLFFNIFGFFHCLIISIYVIVYKRPVITLTSKLIKIYCCSVMVIVAFARSVFVFIIVYCDFPSTTNQYFQTNYWDASSLLSDFSDIIEQDWMFYLRMSIGSISQLIIFITMMIFTASYSLDIYQLHKSSSLSFGINEDSEKSLIFRNRLNSALTIDIYSERTT
ncbi:hypothetical protein cand_039010 [Cryptosporidium andersoni]|uniref:Uncharacterized protein n=1 Tax=Cryptosporidium andersoni TaxID=117008 RepID=A0A1J4MUN1_9CRYT|nr:hypothetical protein cand_039010 [Cryptosporidium andersoni]